MAGKASSSTSITSSSNTYNAGAVSAASRLQSRKFSVLAGCTTILGQPPPEDPICDSGIYCYGPLLHTIQMSELYPDSKTFVDKKLKYPAGKIIKHFEQLVRKQNGELLSKEQIKTFVEENFEDEGLELELWTPEDWTPNPEFIGKLKKPQLRGLAKRINRLWKDLSRRIKDEVKKNSSLYSIICVPNGFVVPGGRFREFYYWDTYWIVKALLHYDMTSTVRGIVENFLLMVSKYGLVPNGGRIYYTKRSQPPFLTLMMKEYVDKTADVQFVRTHLATLEKELEFFEIKRSIRIRIESEEERPTEEFQLFVFGTGGTGPRPESYREDLELAQELPEGQEREDFYFHMKAGAESGWDYSSRWMINKDGENRGTLKDVKTNHIIPVDLNALMYMNYVGVADFHALLGDTVKYEEFMKKANTLAKAIKAVLWDSKEKMWFDYDAYNGKQRKYFYPSNLFPLWAECYDPKEKAVVANSAVDYLMKSGALKLKGGVPTSFDESGQQWDFPNAWPPLQHILVAGLLKTGQPDARKIALSIAKRYTIGTMFSCPDGAEVCNMFEKYNVNETGSAGGGGEYAVQTGFGWTNGVVIDFMATFGDELLNSDDDDDQECIKDAPSVSTQFDTSRGMSKVLTRQLSSVEKAKIGLAGKNQDQIKGDNSLVHPALAIEEDDEEKGEGKERTREQ